MDLETSAGILKELGHPTRLAIFKHLVNAGHDGLAVGRLQEELSVPGSTLSHHLSALVKVGLVRQQREGRTLFCLPQYGQLDKVIEFLKEECCMRE